MSNPSGTPPHLRIRCLRTCRRPPRPWGNYLQQAETASPPRQPGALGGNVCWRPKRILIVDVPIEVDNGTIAHYEGYRVQHNLSRGPGKGVRFHQDVTLSEVMALSAWMSVKNAAVNVPYGGARAASAGTPRSCRRVSWSA